MTFPPKQTFQVRNNGVGLVAQAAVLPVVLGGTVGGVTDTLYTFNDPNAAIDQLTEGPALELALPLIQAGGCHVLKTATSVAASNTAVAKSAIGSSTGTVTVAGTATNKYRVRVRIKASGTVGAGRFDYSLDGGYTDSPELTIPAGGTYVMAGSGLTLTFVPGAGAVFFEAGDIHTFTALPAFLNTTNLSAAVVALLAQIGTYRINRLHIAGRPVDAAAGATLFAGVATQLSNLAAAEHFARATMDTGEDAPATVLTAYAAQSDDRISLCYGEADVSAVQTRATLAYGTPRVPVANVVAERAARAVLSENLGRRASGTLRGVVAITHDQRLAGGFNEADRVTTLTTESGSNAFYITNGYLRSAIGSDFAYWDWGRVIDTLCVAILEGQRPFTLDTLRALTDGTGRLSEDDVKMIEGAVRPLIKSQLSEPKAANGTPGHVSGWRYAVDTENNFLSTRKIRSTGSAVPRAPVEEFETTVGLTRSL